MGVPRVLRDVPLPLGLEPETVRWTLKALSDYKDFFEWKHGVEDSDCQEPGRSFQLDPSEEGKSDVGVSHSQDRWLLERHDLEFFYNVLRLDDEKCACPYDWVAKVKGLIDQQHPIFGGERFPALEDKAAHLVWQLLKQQTFREYDRKVGALAILVLFGRNGVPVQPRTEDWADFFLILERTLEGVAQKQLEEDQAIYQLGDRIRGW